MAVLVLDVDGVVVLGHPDGGRWDRDLLRDLGVAPEELQARFFHRHWPAIVVGQADMLTVLESVWAELQCPLSPRALVDYWFARDSRLNHDLLAEVDRWRAGGNQAYLATVQEHHRARYLWERLELRRHFDAMHYSAALGAAKPDAAFFERFHVNLPVQSRQDVVFLDDAIRNVEAADAFGWRARQFTAVDDVRAALAASSLVSPRD